MAPTSCGRSKDQMSSYMESISPIPGYRFPVLPEHELSVVEGGVLGVLGMVPSYFLQLREILWLAPPAEMQQQSENAGAPLFTRNPGGETPLPPVCELLVQEGQHQQLEEQLG